MTKSDNTESSKENINQLECMITHDRLYHSEMNQMRKLFSTKITEARLTRSFYSSVQF